MSKSPRTVKGETPNDYQPGGSHYRTEPGVEQHWDFIDRWHVPYLEGISTKHIERLGKGKGTDVLDCQKARHYVEKILHEHETKGRQPRVFVAAHEISAYARQHKLNADQELFFHHVLQWREAYTLRLAIGITKLLEKQLHPAEQFMLTEKRRIDNTGQKRPFGYDDEQ